MNEAADRVIIFDTTMRDGEQSPGASMNLEQKLRVAKALRGSRRGHHRGRLRGGLARRFRGHPGRLPAGGGPGHLQPLPLQQGRHRRLVEGARGRAPQALPRVPGHQPHPSRLQAQDGQGGDRPARRGRRVLRPGAVRGRRVLARGRRPHRARVPDRGGGEGHRRRGHHREHPGHGRLRAPLDLRRDHPLPREARPRDREGGGLGPLPQRPGAGGGQQHRRRPGGRPPGGVHHQRDRRAGRQRLARGDRDGVQDAARRAPRHHRRPHREALPHQPRGLAGDRPARAAEQGDGRARTPSRTRPESTSTACSPTARPTR